MNEQNFSLGDGLGVFLVPEKKSKRTMTIEAMMGNDPFPDSYPIIQDGFAHIGQVIPLELPPETLHAFAKIRNGEVYELIREYVELSGEQYFGEAMGNIRVRGRYPLLDKSIYEFPEYKTPHSEELARVLGLSNLKSLYSVGKLSDDSIATAFFIPVYKIYEKYYAKAGEREKENYSSYTAPQNYTRDMVGWRNFIRDLKLPATAFFRQPLTTYIPLEAFKRHAYIVGGSGSGKSELLKLLVHHLLVDKKAQNFSGVVIEPHGDLAEEIARLRIADPERVIFFDPSRYNDKSPSLDIFTPPNEEEKTIDIMASNLVDAFNEIIADSSISSQMRTLLIPCISVLLRRKNSSLADLQRFMIEGQNEDLVELGKVSPNYGQAEFFRIGFHEKTYDTTKRAVYTRLQTLLNSTQFRRMIHPKAEIDLEHELNNGKIVVFSLSKASLGNEVSQAFGRLLMAQIKNIGFRRQYLPKYQRVPCFVFIDECQNYIGESIEVALTELRKYGIHMILANQVIGQNMSSQLTNILLSNTAVKITGYNGDKSLAIMAKEIGAELGELKKLTTGNFYAKVNIPQKITQAFAFKAPKYLLGNNAGVSGEDWLARIQKGWRGYIPNSILDAKRAETALKSPLETFSEQKGYQPTPDYIDPPQNARNSKKPKFDI